MIHKIIRIYKKKTTKNSTCKEAAVGSHQVSAVVNIRKMGDQDNKVCEWLERKVGMQSGRWMCGMDDGGGQERSGFIDGVSNEHLHKKMNGASGLRKRADTKVPINLHSVIWPAESHHKRLQKR